MGRASDSLTPAALRVELPATLDTQPAPSGTRRAAETVSERWSDALLRLSTTLPIDVGAEELGRIFLEGMGPLLPGAALALRLRENRGAEPTLLYRPSTSVSASLARDGARLFAAHSDELVFELNERVGMSGSSLHIALESVDEASREIGERAAMVLGAALGRLRVYARAQDSMRDFHRLQAQVIQTEKLASLGQIVAGVVHELNNPLTSIIAYSDYLTKKLGGDSSADLNDDAERVRRIGEAAARILKFTRDLVAYARPTGDERGLVQIEEVVERALVFCEHEFADGRVEIEQDFALPLPMIWAIPGQLTQVFVNLFTNAAHAMAGHGGVLRIAIRATASGGSLRIDVSDSGSGIPTQAMAQIFEPFFTTKTDGRGTGLGLAIVRGIVDAHGGSIQVSSAPGEGTTFTLTLPVG